MKKKNYLWSLLAIMMVGLLSVSFVSCGGSDDDTPATPVQEPTKSVAPKDPEGTNVINLLIGGDSYNLASVGHILIDKAGNFKGSLGSYNTITFAMLGKVNGLGDVTKIPENENAWASSARVNVGEGYIMKNYYWQWNSYTSTTDEAITYARIYVSEALENGIGYVIKYQSPYEPNIE